ncbi:DUF484 family protein [Stagnihabitans tardus]|uniref:DUF484 family protein n=1 Tax=Stagnihabitans tardus TaxID=2699202 RepID=A0AAE4YBL7_9RHOB|nr:DUF484 family protein [Stagnihabitans tardus]NBZ86950.1 DUF484 family protein [Stagnihabitans tardus]
MIDPDTRDRILASPEALLEDRDVMQALIGANDRAAGTNVVDLRGLAMERLNQKLDRLEDTHRTVIAAAYENLAGTNQVHRAILQLLEPVDFPGFLATLTGTVAQTLRVEAVRLILETRSEGPVPEPVSGAILAVRPGFVNDYLTRGRAMARPVMLRQTLPDPGGIYGEAGDWVRSEALLRLDLGEGRLPGLLALGAEDPHQFKPTHGTDLLAFFGGVFERVMRKWLA